MTLQGHYLHSLFNYSGVSIWEMRDELRGLQFNTTEQWLHKHWSLDGAVQKAW